MYLRVLLRRGVLCGAVVAAVCFAAPALASAQSVSVTPCATCTPSSTGFTAGGDSSTTATLALDTLSEGAVHTISTQLGAGLLANLSSTSAVACITPSLNSSPDTNANCVIGTGTATPAGAFTAYLTPPNTLSTTPPGTVLAGMDLVSTSPSLVIHGDLSIEQLNSGGLVGVLTSDLSTATTDSFNSTVTGLTLNLNGTLNGSPLINMPTACTLATPTQMTVTYADESEGPTNASPDVSVASTCSSLHYTPTLSGSASTTGTNQGARVSTVVSQPAGQSNSASTTLSVPSTLLIPNASAIVLANTTTAVGTAEVTSPLIPLPLTGNVYLTETNGALGLSLRFTSPFTFTLNGSVGLTTGSVTFGSVPDVPISALAVTLNGGSDALFESPCAAISGTLSSAFVAQNGAKASPTAPFTVSGCPATTSVGKPTVSGGSLTGLSSGHPKLHFKATHGSGAPNIKSVSVGVPSGLSFHTSKVCTGHGSHKKCTSKVKGVSVSGGTVKSAKISGGRLVITLKSAASSVSVTVSGPGLKETKALKTKVKKHKVKKETVSIKITNASGTATSISLKLSV
jgi:hypothetical protein